MNYDITWRAVRSGAAQDTSKLWFDLALSTGYGDPDLIHLFLYGA